MTPAEFLAGRKRLGLTQLELARRFGEQRSRIIYTENHARGVPRDLAEKMKQLLATRPQEKT